jgi:hypothetical protein
MLLAKSWRLSTSTEALLTLEAGHIANILLVAVLLAALTATEVLLVARVRATRQILLTAQVWRMALHMWRTQTGLIVLLVARVLLVPMRLTSRWRCRENRPACKILLTERIVFRGTR